MITFTDVAAENIKQFIDQAGEECIGLRVRAAKIGRYTFRYQLHLVREQDVSDDDTKLEHDSFTVFVDPQTAEWMEGATIDFITEGGASGFQIRNPAADPQWDDPVAKKVQQVIDEKVLPSVGSHGGFVELDHVEGDTAYIHLGGGCQGCASASFTLKEGIEKVITEEVDEIAHVEDITNHAAGTQPYHSG